MSKSSPTDLSVTFRSLARRQREAAGDADPSSMGDLATSLQGHVAAAAAVMGTTADAEAVAAAIDARQADAWDTQTLDVLRQHALDAGAVLRQIAARAEADS